jgi:hypothetical protein
MCQDIFKTLPLELIYIILSYTYEPQSKTLTADIKDNYKTKQIIHKLYNERYVTDFNEPEPSDKEWLINDLFGFSNSGTPTMNGYVDTFYDLFLKHFSIKTHEQVIKFVERLETLELVSQINIFWALFSIKERNDFLVKYFPYSIII